MSDDMTLQTTRWFGGERCCKKKRKSISEVTTTSDSMGVSSLSKSASGFFLFSRERMRMLLSRGVGSRLKAIQFPRIPASLALSRPALYVSGCSFCSYSYRRLMVHAFQESERLCRDSGLIGLTLMCHERKMHLSQEVECRKSVAII